jgi:hypothetical protein
MLPIARRPDAFREADMMSRIAIFGVAALALAGCRTDPNVPILERELRLQEDKIYQLQSQLAESRAQLEACRCPSGGPASADAGAPGRPAPPPAEVTGPALTPGGPAEPVVPQPPIVELPGQSQSQIPGTLQEPKGPPPTFERSKPAPETTPPAVNPPPANPPTQPAPSNGNRWRKASSTGRAVQTSPATPTSNDPVDRILLNPSLTCGLNADGKPGDEGLAVLIEPQDSRGRLVTRPAPVSVVVLDRQASGQAARVARWDFTAEQVAQRIRRTSAGSGIYFELPWPNQAPAHGDVQLFVRYAADESRQLEAAMPLAIELPGQPKQWTAAAPGSTKRTVAAAPLKPAPAAASEPARLEESPPRGAARPERLEAAEKPRPADPPRSEARRPVWSPNR